MTMPAASAYLDHQSGTPLHPAAREALLPWLEDPGCPPTSVHRHGHRSQRALAEARETFAGFLGAASADEIIFTAGSTEALNLALTGAFRAAAPERRLVIVSALDHPAVLRPVEALRAEGAVVKRLEHDETGRLSPSLPGGAAPALVAIHLVNHDLGTVQDVRALADAAHAAGAVVVVDAVAAAGWVPVDVRALGADLLVISAARLGGPRGCAVLYRRSGVAIEPLVRGGGQEFGLRAGNENVPAIAAAAAAARAIGPDPTARAAHARHLQAFLVEEALRRVPAIRLNGPPPGPRRAPYHVSLSLEHLEAEAVALALDLKGVFVHAGAACVARDLRVPPALLALGVPETWARGTLLATLGPETTQAEAGRFIDALEAVAKRLRPLFLPPEALEAAEKSS